MNFKNTKIISGIVTAAIIVLFASNKFISKPNENVLMLGFAGDTMLGRLVNQVITAQGYRYVWGNILSELQKNDINIVNLETTLTTSSQAVSKVFNFKADPDKVQVLKEGSIDVVNLANNHILDFSESGLFDTINALESLSIAYVGAGKNLQEARKPLIITKNGISIGIIGCTDNEPDWKAGETKPGTNYISTNKYTPLLDDIKQLHKQVDIVIVTMHWGPNFRERPAEEFITFAHALIDAGVAIFCGHSAHIVQAIELYNNGLIMYDTGDFVDDYAVDPKLRNDLSFLFHVTVTKAGIKNVSLIPVRIENMQVNKAKDNDYRFITQRMQTLSQEFGVRLIEKNGKLQVAGAS